MVWFYASRIFHKKDFNFSDAPPEGGAYKKPLTIKTYRFYVQQFFRVPLVRALKKKHFSSWLRQLPNNFYFTIYYYKKRFPSFLYCLYIIFIYKLYSIHACCIFLETLWKNGLGRFGEFKCSYFSIIIRSPFSLFLSNIFNSSKTLMFVRSKSNCSSCSSSYGRGYARQIANSILKSFFDHLWMYLRSVLVETTWLMAADIVFGSGSGSGFIV